MGYIFVFEYMLSDLSEVIRNVSQPLTNSQIKSYMRMLLNGVSFCHENRIMHRVKSHEEENNSNSFSI
jgi:cell cycle related kinase